MPRKKKPRREDLRVMAVGVTLQREVTTGHMTPALAKTLLTRMDHAYELLVKEHFPEAPTENPPNG
jgi:hypothetical protein